MKECQVTPERSPGFVKERGPVGILHCFWGVMGTKHHLRIKMGKSFRASGSSAFLQISSFCSFCGGNRIFKYSSQASGDFDFIGIPLKESMLPKGQGGGGIKATCLCGVWHAPHTGVLQPVTAGLPSFLCPFIVPGRTWGVWLWTGASGEAAAQWQAGCLTCKDPGPNSQNQTLHSKEKKTDNKCKQSPFFLFFSGLPCFW